MKEVTKLLLFVMMLTIFWVGVNPAPSLSQKNELPFTAEEDADGARFLWWAFGQAGFCYRYIPAKSIPYSDNFRPDTENKPEAGHIAWWKEFVALFAGKEVPGSANLLTGRGKASLKNLETKFGPVKWYQLMVPNPTSEPPKEKVASIDKKLEVLEPSIGMFPPAINSDSGLQRIKTEWELVEKEIMTISQAYSNSAEIEVRFGEVYRLGHNIDLPGAWEKSESHYSRALKLSPWSVPAYVGLGLLYVNTNPAYAAQAEHLFKEAIKVSYGKDYPIGAFSGLIFSYYYQGRPREALAAADDYLKRRPNDENMKHFRELIRKVIQDNKKDGGI